jgi:DNA-binding beta-propeller fold protein YncE
MKTIRFVIIFFGVLTLTLLQFNTVFAEVEMNNFTSFNKPVGLAWIDDHFLASTRNGDTRLITVSADGERKEPFAPEFSGAGEVYIALSHGKAGFPEDYIYVSSGNSIYEIDPEGNNVRLFSTPFEDMGLGYIAFDTVGTWGNLLYAVNFNGLLWSVDSNGNAELIINMGDHLLPEHILVAPEDFGDFGGDLIISLEMDRKIVAISPEDTSTVIVLAEYPEESPERILLIPSENNLYLAKMDQNIVVEITANQFSPYTNGLVVITEGEYGERGSISVLQAEGNTIIKTILTEGEENPHYEGAVFVPIEALAAATSKPFYQNLSTTDILVIALLIVSIIILLTVLLSKRRKN